MGRMTAYINPQSSQQLRDTAGYTLADGSPALNVVCIFAGNYAAAKVPYLRANNDDPPTTNPFNDNIQQVLDDGSVQYLQSKGLTVLLTITNGWQPVGWSEFTSESDAMDFASYLKTDVVDKYGLDGIDIDDEYSTGTPNDTSLVMVTTLMRQIMPDKIISKALWQDYEYFKSTWNGHTLAGNLSYGAEMSYGGSPQSRLEPYTNLGLGKDQLSLGFWSGQPSPDPDRNVQWLKENGYGGVMIFGFEEQANVDLMGQLVDDWYGPGNWNPPQ
ncbi:MAG TPA: glycosyl hydrolase family 18 protein [Thermoanaerobaculia bacterium]|nr:glycosyl hydrolase family 18 protein [Thermoanaerobaculia bacterium]